MEKYALLLISFIIVVIAYFVYEIVISVKGAKIKSRTRATEQDNSASSLRLDCPREQINSSELSVQSSSSSIAGHEQSFTQSHKPNKSGGDEFITSMVVSAATNNIALGLMAGRSLSGAIIGEALNTSEYTNKEVHDSGESCKEPKEDSYLDTYSDSQTETTSYSDSNNSSTNDY